MKIDMFWGDLTDISTKTEALVGMRCPMLGPKAVLEVPCWCAHQGILKLLRVVVSEEIAPFIFILLEDEDVINTATMWMWAVKQ